MAAGALRALVQRVGEARVTVADEEVGAIGPGLLVLLCAMRGDGPDAPARMAAKLARLRVFRDEAGRMNRSLLEVGGAALVVSQFTLAAETKGNRPGFSAAAPPEEGEAAYEATVAALRDLGIETATGRFGADMAVALVNDGPVTIPIDL
jgi:D-tyrosyl-tRNA(Tyr) deacylase